jgi:protein-S-isoprenylcysteine O-methyltransferase Ste14
MILDDWLILACWLTLVAYWLIAAVGVKKNVRGHSWWRGVAIRIALGIALWLILRLPGFRPFLAFRRAVPADPAIAGAGVALCASGIALSIWARWHLGRNWGMPMSLKEGHELVTAGPYRIVRHPIYTGILLAMIGSMVTGNLLWLVLFVLFGGYFVYSATVEEQLMLRQFPDRYPAYQKRTKMLIPFVF